MNCSRSWRYERARLGRADGTLSARRRCVRILRSLLTAFVLVPLVACAAESGDAPTDTSAEDLTTSAVADSVLNGMLAEFWDAAHGEFRASATSYWINAQAFDAVLDGVQRPSGAQFAHWVRKVRDGNEREYGGFFTASYKKTYFDDITWMTLALMRASDLTAGSEKAAYLADAERVFQPVMDRAPSSENGQFAGLWWNSTHDFDEKATASNFGPVIAAAHLYEHTKKGAYKTFAEKVYAHWHGTMVERQPDGTAFVVDNVQGGNKSRPRFTYNQGLGVGAALAMSDLAGSPSDKASYGAQARAMADYLVKYETRMGVLLDYDANDTTPSACTGDCAAFKGVAYRYLAALYERDVTRADYYQVLHSSAHAILANDHDTAAHRFGTRWDVGGREDDRRLAANASAVMALQIFARLPKPQ